MISLALLTLLAAAPYDDAMSNARALYRDADWDGALAALATAEASAETDAQKVDVYLCRGVVLANVPDADRAQAAWQQGLLLDPNATLTLSVTAKIQQQFDRTKRTVQATREAVIREQAAQKPPPAVEAAAPAPGVEEPPSRGVPTVTLVTGAVAVASLIGGIALTFSTLSQVQRVRDGYADEQLAFYASAKTQEALAFTAYGLAGAAALTALITWLLLR